MTAAFFFKLAIFWLIWVWGGGAPDFEKNAPPHPNNQKKDF
jgi:hypothetical protein